MTKSRMEQTEPSPADDDAPPRGTAIVRPLRHVRAVRERYLLRFADLAKAADSRSVRAWAWALGESAIAPVTDQQTAVPPTRHEIEAEIVVADGRRLRGDQENRADAAATILCWLIGDDDHLPMETDNPGELVGGFGDIVRSLDQIADMLAFALQSQRRAAAWDQDIRADPAGRRLARQDVDYLGGVGATLAWVLGKQPEAPITRERHAVLTTRDLKRERLSADDVIEQARYVWMADRLPSLWYGEGVKLTVSWLLGDTTAQPVDSAGHGPYDPESDLPAILREAQTRGACRF